MIYPLYICLVTLKDRFFLCVHMCVYTYIYLIFYSSKPKCVCRIASKLDFMHPAAPFPRWAKAASFASDSHRWVPRVLCPLSPSPLQTCYIVRMVKR